MKNDNRLNIIVLVVVFILFFGLLSIYRVDLASIATLGLLLMMVFLKFPYLALASVVLVVPFASMALLDQQLAGIPGMKISNLLILATTAVYLFSGEKIELGKRELFFFGGIILFLLLGVLRSLPHLNEINWSLEPKLGTAKYVLTYFVRPIIYLIPFLIVVVYMKDRNSLSVLKNIIAISMFCFSLYLIVFYLFWIPNKGNLDFVRHVIYRKFNMHSNDLVNYYILFYPILLAIFLSKKNLVNLTNLILSLMGVVVLYSRTGYVAIIFSTLLLLSMTRNKKWIPVLVFVGILTVYFFPSDILERSTTGISSGDIDIITAGRTEHIWIPLIKEYINNPVELMVGNGTNAILYSKSFKRDYILRVGHAHNMYLNTVLEVGLIGLSFFLYYFFSYLKTFARSIKELEGQYYFLLAGVVVSVSTFMLSGLSGRQFFPDLSNIYLWIVLAFGISILKSCEHDEAALNEEEKNMLCVTQPLSSAD